MIQPAPKSPLTEAQLVRFRELLLEERMRIRDSLVRLHREAVQGNPENPGDLPARTPPADLGGEAFEQEENFGLAEQFSRVASEIDRALERMEEGTYGTCETCDRPVPLERLEAITYATRCAACQAQVEKDGDSG